MANEKDLSIEDIAHLTLEHLKVIRTDIANIKGDVRDLKDGMNSVRSEVNLLRGDILRQERAIAALEVDVDRINTRLGLIDPQQ